MDLGHTNLRCNRQVLKHRSMAMFDKGPRPLEEGARAARGGTRHVLGRSVLIDLGKRAGLAGSEDVVALPRALFVRTFASVIEVREGHECGTCWHDKIHVGHDVVVGSSVDQGRSPYEDADC